ncbi:MAG: winged helix-turn-helix transcriptional regulator [Thermodesulfobacteriota bacterium]
MKPTPVSHRVCSVARTLEILGDRWIFLILREAFFGVRNYDQFLSNLGIATNILSDRLKILVSHGILEKRKDRVDARRNRYRLTEKGLDLYTIVLAFMQWGDRWLADADGPPLELFHKNCGNRLTPVMSCAACGKPVIPKEVGYMEKNPFQPKGKTALKE